MPSPTPRVLNLVVLLLLGATAPARATLFASSTQFTNAVGPENLMTLDFEGIRPPGGFFTPFDGPVEGFAFDAGENPGSGLAGVGPVDVSFLAGPSVLTTNEQDRPLRIFFPEPVTAVGLSANQLDFFNEAGTNPGQITGFDLEGAVVFQTELAGPGDFLGFFDPNNPIQQLDINPGSGSRITVPSIRYAVPEPGVAASLALAGASLGLRRRSRR